MTAEHCEVCGAEIVHSDWRSFCGDGCAEIEASRMRRESRPPRLRGSKAEARERSAQLDELRKRDFAAWYRIVRQK